MITATGFSPSAMQANAAFFNVEAIAKAPKVSRDDVVAPINTTNGEAAKSDVSLLKMSNPGLGQNVDIKV